MIFDSETLAAWTGGRWTTVPNRPISGFNQDSRLIEEANLFVALPGERQDGHAFVSRAAAAGAAGALVSRQQVDCALPQLVVDDPLTALHTMARRHRETFTRPVIAVTGSCGKTSTKDLLAQLLGSSQTCATPGNFNNLIGVPLSLLRIDPARHRFAVIEAGINQPGEMERLGAMIQPTHVIVTMIGPAHLELLGSLDGVAREKSQLAQGKFLEAVVLLQESAQYPSLSRFGEKCVVLTRSEEHTDHFNGPATYRLDIEKARDFSRDSGPSESSPEPIPNLGGRILVRPPLGPEFAFQAPPLSPGMLRNASLCLVVAQMLQVPFEALSERLVNWRPSQQRGTWREADGRAYYVDCYNANPASMADSLSFFDAVVSHPPRTFVLGGMRELGESSGQWHQQVAASLPARSGDYLILVGQEATDYQLGWRHRWPRPLLASLSICPDLSSAFGPVADSSGPVFLKGSRSYGLENLVPGAERASEEGVAC